MRTLLCALLLVGACKPKLTLSVDAYHSAIPNKARVTVSTAPHVMIKVAGQTRETSSGREFFDVPLDKLETDSVGGYKIHVEVERGSERMTREFRLGRKFGGPPISPGKYGVQLIAGAEGNDYMVTSPFGLTITVGTPPAIVFQVGSGTQVAVAGTPLIVENGKAVWVVELDKVVTQVPTTEMLPSTYRPAKVVVPVRVTDAAGPHDETVTLERADSRAFVSAIERLIEPVRQGKPVDLGPSPTGGFIVVSTTSAGHSIVTGGPMATLKDATIAVWKTTLPSKSGGSCSYLGPRSGHIKVPVSYGSIELAAYDLRKGKLKKKVVLRGKGSRCPTVITTFGGSAGSINHDPLQSEIDAALAKLTR
jgi:hypothetical protein